LLCLKPHATSITMLIMILNIKLVAVSDGVPPI